MNDFNSTQALKYREALNEAGYVVTQREYPDHCNWFRVTKYTSQNGDLFYPDIVETECIPFSPIVLPSYVIYRMYLWDPSELRGDFVSAFREFTQMYSARIYEEDENRAGVVWDEDNSTGTFTGFCKFLKDLRNSTLIFDANYHTRHGYLVGVTPRWS